jgi:aminopeptidase N
MRVTPAFHAAVKAATAFSALLLTVSMVANAQRLPTTVVPEHYTLSLTPDLNTATFSGTESIEMTVTEAASTITLNSAEIAFQSVTVESGGARQTATVTLDADKQQATFRFAQPLSPGKAILSIRYTGILNSQLRGFYLSKTEHRNYAVTQFEPTDARRAFPSFDEPAFKAAFDISLVVDAKDTAISNNPIANDSPGPGEGKHTLKFLTTPKMSTYLVAFLVGDFQCTAGEQDGVAIRVCATPDKVGMTATGVEDAQYFLHYYNNYFGIPYPLKKLDLIALPDFEAGAMENFGAITYRETLLLIDPKTASDNAKENVALVIAHEMAHQWFGDMVTMRWWDNLWLNEGFATWMENKAVVAMHPDWNVDESVAASEDSTLDLDAQPTTRAIRAKAETPDQINEMFDGIAYGKAGDVLLMVENYLGAETFRQGVHNYLVAHQYSNATAEDFWGAQTAASHKPVDRIMDSLVAQPGAPLITFGQPIGGKVAVEQMRFFLSPSVKADPKQKWTLPICFKSSAGDTQDCQLLTPTTSTLNVPAGPIFFANATGKGYYRSAYPASVYAELVANAESKLSAPERVSLLGDAWAQVRSNKKTVGDYLDLAASLKSDTGNEVISSALGGVGAIMDRVAASADQKATLAAWLRRNFTPLLKKLGPPSQTDTPNIRLLRATLFETLGYYGKDPEVLTEAAKIAEKSYTDPESVDPTLGQTAMSITVRNGDAALFDRLQKVYETSNNPEMRNGALLFLPQFQNPQLAKRSLDYALSGKVRNQDVAIELSVGLQAESNRDLTWNYIKANWNKVQAQLTTEMGRRLVSATSSFCTVESRDDVENFFTTHKVAASERALKHAVERINGCIEFRTLQGENLKRWLATQPAK